MPQRGRPPQPGTAEEKAAIRREKVRLYVKAHRERKKTANSTTIAGPADGHASSSRSASVSSTAGSSGGSEDDRLPQTCSCPEPNCRHQQCVKREAKAERPNPKQERQAVIKQNFRHDRPPKPALQARSPGAKEFALAVMGVFRGQYLPTRVRVPNQDGYGSELNTPCSAWITQAYTVAQQQESSALKSCLLACGLALTSLQHQDERLKIASLDVYRKALRQVRAELKPLTAGTTTNYLLPYLSCLAAATFEILHDGFSENIMQHVKGAISLMELLPRDTNVRVLVNDLLLEDLCMWEIVFALKYRYPSPLRRVRQRKGQRDYHVADKTGASSRNATVLGDLLDGADEIPAIMAQLDQLQAQPPSTTKLHALQLEVSKLARVRTDLDLWATRFQARFGPVYIPYGEQVDSKSQPGMAVQFVSYEIAAAWLYYLTFSLCALDTEIEVFREIISLHASQAPSLSMVAAAAPAGPTASMPAGYGTPQVVPVITAHIPRPPPGHDDAPRGIKNVVDAPPTVDVGVAPSYMRLLEARSRLRSLCGELSQACCVFAPIPKGVIGSSLILFPMDRFKTITKREVRRLQDDLVAMGADEIQDDSRIMQLITDLSSSLTMYEALEQMMLAMGMAPMDED